MRHDDLDDESWQIREVFAHFGAAMHSAQVLEHGLVNAMVYLELIPIRAGTVKTKEEWASAFDQFMDRHFEGTLGRMIHNLSQVTTVPSDIQGLLSKALKKRNWMAHAYFRERALELATTEGRDKMIHELSELDSFFRDVDRRLDDVIRPTRERYGFTDDRLYEEYKAMLREHQISHDDEGPSQKEKD